MSEQFPEPIPQGSEPIAPEPAEPNVIEIEAILGVYEAYDAATGELLNVGFSED